MTNVLNSLKALVFSVIKFEPALVVGVVVAVVGAVAGVFGIVIDPATVGQVVAYVIAVLGGSVVVRQAVTPNAKVLLQKVLPSQVPAKVPDPNFTPPTGQNIPPSGETVPPPTK